MNTVGTEILKESVNQLCVHAFLCEWACENQAYTHKVQRITFILMILLVIIYGEDIL